MKLLEIVEIKGKLIVETGLRIGAGDTEMRIGGLDNPIIKHPHTLEPYIPGSSLKGKVRSLLEMKSGLMVHTKGEPVAFKYLAKLEENLKREGEKILKLFGAGAAEGEKIEEIGPTRVSFADCPLTPEWRQKALTEGLAFTEVKSENSINRIRGTAEDPRQMERVPAGAEFAFRVTLKKFQTNGQPEGEELEDLLLEGLKLLQLDALGGCGSRGYGRIRLELEEPYKSKLESLQPFSTRG